MPKTPNVGYFCEIKVRVPYVLWQQTAERSKAEGVSMSTIVRDALHIFLGNRGLAPDRVHRPMLTQPTNGRASPSTPPLVPDPALVQTIRELQYGLISPTAALARGAPPARSPLTLKRKPSSILSPPRAQPPSSGQGKEEMYPVPMHDDTTGNDYTKKLPLSKLFAFWNSVPPPPPGGGGPRDDDIARVQGEKARLSFHDAFQVLAAFRFDMDLIDRLRRMEAEQKYEEEHNA